MATVSGDLGQVMNRRRVFARGWYGAVAQLRSWRSLAQLMALRR
jgi:hypothetical protein